MKLLNETISYAPPDNYTIPQDVILARDEMVVQASQIKSISTAEVNGNAGASVRQMRQYVKDVESVRVAITKPLLDGQRLIKATADEHIAVVTAEITRLEKLGTLWIQSERQRVEAEEKAKRDAFLAAQKAQFEADEKARIAAEKAAQDATDIKSKLAAMDAARRLSQAQAATQVAIAAPEPEENRAKGQSVRKKLCWEVVDIQALAKARPELVRMEPNAAAINAVCNPNLPVPGLSLWFEEKSTYSSR